MRQRTKLKKKIVNHSERPDLELTYKIFFLAYPVGKKRSYLNFLSIMMSVNLLDDSVQDVRHTKIIRF